METPSQWLDRGRIGSQAPVADKTEDWWGILLDASCPDRDQITLREPPEFHVAREAPQPSGTNGIVVPPRILAEERDGVMLLHTPDHLTRELSPGCAITGSTKAFSLLVPEGKSWRLVDLDEGGNTLAFEAFQSSPEGQQVLNGRAASEKPVARVVGRPWGDKLIASTVQLERPQKTPPVSVEPAPIGEMAVGGSASGR